MVDEIPPEGFKALRHALGDALDEGLTGVLKNRIIPFPKSLDNLESGRVVLMLDRTGLVRLPTNPIGDYRNDITLSVIGYRTDGGLAEDILDDALDAVILVLDGVDWLIWREARRAVFGDQQAPCYQITLEAVSGKKE